MTGRSAGEDQLEFGATLIEDLADTARSIVLEDGDVLVAEGDEADDVFFVLDGRIEASTATPYGEVAVGTIEEGQIVGEVTVIAGGRRTATLRADGHAAVLAVHRSDFEAWLDSNPAIADAVSDQARERIDRSQVASMVTDLVGSADRSVVQDVVDRVRWRRLAAGETLFEQGDPSDSAYFVVGGRVMVLIRNDDGTEQPVRELGRGEVVGELGLLDRAPRSATVRAVRDTTLAAFSTEAFEEMVSQSPALMLSVTRGILTRIKVPPRRFVDRAAALTVAVTAPADSGELAAAIASEIRNFGTVRHLSSARVDALLNRPDISQAAVDNVGVPRLAEFMHEADVGNDHVVLEADPELTAWTRRVLHQADRVVIVVSPRPGRDERRRIGAMLDALRGVTHVARMLAVLHPAHAGRPRGTASLLREFTVDEVVHVRSGSAHDIARLARLASGHGVGLVLSGGGARGFAHIGAHRALLEAGVPIDHVGGSSMGAPLAGGIARGLSGEALVTATEAQFHRLLDYTIPMVSLVKGERITRSIEAAFGSWDIEDFWLPYYCVSTNLTTSRLEVHRRGSASHAIRASVAIPGVLPPVPHDGDLLVDGGVLDNLPIEMMRQDGTIGTIIAVDVAPAQGPRARSDYGLSVSGLRALGARLRGNGSPYPSVSSVLLRSMLTGAVRTQQEALRDGGVNLLLPLHLPGIGLLEFERVRPVAQAGYEASRETIAAWAAAQPWLGRTA
jgi:predicted acylesterase/phospholipase RssA/CRP-like cAMP-binding protein